MSTIPGTVLEVGTSLVILIVVKVSLVWAVGLSATGLARKSRAALRHALLTAAFGVTLVLPIASIFAPPVRIALPIVEKTRTAPPPLMATPDTTRFATRIEASARFKRAAPHAASLSISALLIAGWIVGVILALLPMGVGLWEIRSMRRTGLPWLRGQALVEALAAELKIHRRVEVLLHEKLPGPMTCGVIHPAIVLPPDAQAWEEDDLNRAIVHELEHMRRRDWMTQCFARATCAIYWFHPLIWMVWRRLLLEAERSCDDAVLGRSEATAYADQLVAFARRCAMAKLPLPAMANRADLATRIRAVLDGDQRRGRMGRFSASVVCGAAMALVTALSPIVLVAATQAAATFQTASINAHPDGQMDVYGVYIQAKGARGAHDGRLEVVGFPLTALIQMAYNVKDFQLSGAPSWMRSDRYDVYAKAAGNATFEQMQPMLQSLLGERFKLALHREIRELPVYELVPAEGGFNIEATRAGSCVTRNPATVRPPTPNGPWPCGGWRRTILSAPQDRKDRLEAVGMSMPELIDMLSDEVGRIVIDRTGFTERFDFQLEFAPPDESIVWSIGPHRGTPGPAPSRNPSAPSIFSALHDRLGLRLESTTGPVEVLVIDSVEKLSEN
ncbi:MAG TPA: M56 family metallopeptidase [Bryobacteraceae bacterium]